ncbi:putative polynucleotide kinase [Erwinia phage Snitter]|nr:putative polynucleotide kinase [Erwinia phage Snitter]
MAIIARFAKDNEARSGYYLVSKTRGIPMNTFEGYTQKLKRLVAFIQDQDLKNIVIVDLDGTLSDGRGRLHLLPTENTHLTKTWTEFNLAAVYDLPFKKTIKVVSMLRQAGATIIILTGRSDIAESVTKNWLAINGVQYDFLFMRSHEDNRKDTVIKEEFVWSVGLSRITCAFDDSPEVIRTFRNLGITTYAVVDYGDVSKRPDINNDAHEKH